MIYDIHFFVYKHKPNLTYSLIFILARIWITFPLKLKLFLAWKGISGKKQWQKEAEWVLRAFTSHKHEPKLKIDD